MESKDFGAEEAARQERRAAEKAAYFAEVRKRLIESGAEPLTREQFEQQVAVARERNRRNREEQQRSQQNSPDTTS